VNIKEFLSLLKDVRPRGSGWRALCPAHPDKRPSLDIDAAPDGTILLTCRSRGCSAGSIVSAIGLTLADLFPESNRQVRRRTRKTKVSPEDAVGVEIAEKFDRACDNAYRRLRCLYWTASRIFAAHGLEITDDEAWWIRDLPYLDWVMDLLLSDDPEVKYAGLQVVGRWLV
jgi:hypothetical protein